MPVFYALRLEDQALNFSVKGKHESIDAFLMSELYVECMVESVVYQIENLLKGDGYTWIDLWTPLFKGDSHWLTLKSIRSGEVSLKGRTLQSKFSPLIPTENGNIFFFFYQVLEYLIFIFYIRATEKKNGDSLEQEAENYSMYFDVYFFYLFLLPGSLWLCVATVLVTFYHK